MRGKWAEGIVPRNFAWVIKDRLAVCERPGGYGENHRRVRRQEEIIWIRQQGFHRVISLIPAPHNLHNYEELDVEYLHRPFGPADHDHEFLPALYVEMQGLLSSGERLIVHGEEVGDRLSGLLGGYLVWTGMVPHGPQAISIIERIVTRQMGPRGRGLVALAADLRPASK
jgi:hypothetical protein